MTLVRSALTISVLIMLLSLAGFVMPAAAHTIAGQKYEQAQSKPGREWWKTHRVKYTQRDGRVTYGDCTVEADAEKKARDYNQYQEAFVPPDQRSYASKVHCPHRR